MKVRTYKKGYDIEANSWFISFELESGATTEPWRFNSELEVMLTLQMLQDTGEISLTNINGVLCLQNSTDSLAHHITD